MIKTEVTKVSYIEQGSTKTFAFPFKVDQAKDIAVYTWDGKTLARETDFTVTPTDGKFPTTGGKVFYPASDGSSPVADGTVIYIMRAMPYLQLTEYARNNSLSLEDLEQSLDSAVEMIQQLAESDSRAIHVGIEKNGFTLPEPEEGNILMWKDGNLVNYDEFNFLAKLTETEKNTKAYLDEAKTTLDSVQSEVDAGLARIDNRLEESLKKVDNSAVTRIDNIVKNWEGDIRTLGDSYIQYLEQLKEDNVNVLGFDPNNYYTKPEIDSMEVSDADILALFDGKPPVTLPTDTNYPLTFATDLDIIKLFQ